MMRRRLLCALALVGTLIALGPLAGGCGASESSQQVATTEPEVTLSGFSGKRLEVMEGIRAKLPSDTAISTADLVPAPQPPQNENGSEAFQRAGDVWLTLGSDISADDVSQAKARWEASLVLAAFWRRLRAEGDTGLRGGNLVFTKPPAESGGVSTLEYRFAPDASSYLFTDAAGKPSPLTADHETLEQAILTEAEAMGLTVDSIEFSGIESTAVSVEATADDAITFVRTYGRSYGDLFGDPGLLEGIFLVVRDADGNLVKNASWATGLQGGEGGLSEQYVQ